MPPQFIYTMKGLGKVHPPDHVVLKDIWLSFLPGAKIGVLGLNGSGKSSLLRIMAGEDQRSSARPSRPKASAVGFLQQEPRLDPAKTVLGNVEEGVAETRALLNRYDEINAQFRRGPLARRKWTRSSRSRARSRTASRRRTAGTSTRASSWRWTRCGFRRQTPTSRRCRAASGAASRCAACCCARPICCCSTSRRTISTPNRSRGSSGSSRTTPARSSP